MPVFARLLLIVLVALLPGLAVAVHGQWTVRDLREREVYDSAARLGASVAGELRQIVEGVERLAITLARVPAVTNAVANPRSGTGACTRVLAELTRDYPVGIGLAVADRDGTIVCAQVPMPPGIRVTGDHHARAMATGRFAIGGYGEAPSGAAFLTAAYPLTSAPGREPTGSVLVGIRLDWLAERLSSRFADGDTVVTVADRNFVYLLRVPGPGTIVGQEASAAHRAFAAMAERGAIEGVDQEGVRRIGAINGLAFGEPGAGFDVYIGTGIRRDSVMAPIDAADRQALLLLAGGIGLALGAAWWGGRRFVGAPVAALETAAQRWRAGDYAARVGGGIARTDEFARLRDAFDGMASEIEARSLALAASEERFRTLAELVPSIVWFTRPDGTFDYANERFFAFTGTRPPIEPEGIGALLHPQDREITIAGWRAAVAAKAPYEGQFRFRRADGEYEWFLARAEPVSDGEGRLSGWFGASTNIQSLKDAESHRTVLIAELNHRVKNTLATIQGIAQQSLRGDDVAAARRVFEGRLLALSRAHDVVTRGFWSAAPLREIVGAAVEPFGGGAGGAFAIEGPDRMLAPRTALGLSLALHELATNAIRHGSLSAPRGRVRIAWWSDGAHLRVEWREEGGPPVSEPTRRGFGLRLIASELSRDVADVRLDFAREGLVCTFRLPACEDVPERALAG